MDTETVKGSMIDINDDHNNEALLTKQLGNTLKVYPTCDSTSPSSEKEGNFYNDKYTNNRNVSRLMNSDNSDADKERWKVSRSKFDSLNNQIQDNKAPNVTSKMKKVKTNKTPASKQQNPEMNIRQIPSADKPEVSQFDFCNILNILNEVIPDNDIDEDVRYKMIQICMDIM